MYNLRTKLKLIGSKGFLKYCRTFVLKGNLRSILFYCRNFNDLRKRCSGVLIMKPSHWLILCWSAIFALGISQVRSQMSRERANASELSIPVSNTRKEHVCSSVTIQNSVDNFKELTNCTVIEGNLKILLIDYGKKDDYDTFHFPDLVEITGYFLLYRAYGLHSLGHIFPNLAVIRGKTELFFQYALIVFEMFDLKELGLYGLMTIENGGVRLEKNPGLCYTNRIAWDYITQKKIDDNFIRDNKADDECVNYCRSECKEKCWDSDHDHCQKTGCQGCSAGCFGDGQCCHDQCLGGCNGPSDRDCIVCKHVFYDGQCIPKCPPNTYKLQNRRCITETQCRELGKKKVWRWNGDEQVFWKVIVDTDGGVCVKECLTGYKPDTADKHKCVPCQGRCPKVCKDSYVIDVLSQAKVLKGCTTVEGSIEIEIQTGENIAHVLEDALGDIEEVGSYVKIVRSYPLLSLSFFKNLRLVRGNNLENEKYAFMILDNRKLQEIWNTTTHPKLTLERGEVFFHYNRKLCYDKITNFINHTSLNTTPTTETISPVTNGDEAACRVTKLNLTINAEVSPTVVIAKWTRFLLEDHRRLLGYVLNYREAPERNITIFSGRDACSTKTWHSVDHEPLPYTESAPNEAELIQYLKPYRQYAIYVQTYTTASATEGAVSNIEYFRTLPDVPSPPANVRVNSPYLNTLKVKWDIPDEPNGNITHYFVYYRPQKLSALEFEKRNYCKQPVKQNTEVVNVPEDKTPTISNVTNNGLCCMTCPKSDKERAQEQLEQHIRIKFENFLHNSVFTKRPLYSSSDSSSGGRRRRRDATKYPIENTSLEPTDATTTIGLIVNGTITNSTVENKTKEEAEEEEEPFLTSTVYHALYTFLPNLKHFTIYNIEVIACQDYDNATGKQYCSNRAITTHRTDKSPTADDINQTSVTVHSNGTSNDVMIKWDAPSNPNGLIVSHNLKYKLTTSKDAAPNTRCIAHKKYQQDGGYTLENLPPGNYSVRIQIESLAGRGNWTAPVTFLIEPKIVSTPPPPGTETGVIIGIVSAIAVVIIALAVGGALVYAKRRPKLQDNLYASVNPEYWSGECVYVKDDWEVLREKIKLMGELGQGSFGMVYKGLARNLHTFADGVTEMQVAVKTVNETASMRDRIEFLNEASVMKSFNSFHVVKLLGVVSEGQPTLVIMELMAQGDLKNYLRMHRPDEPDNEGRQPPTLEEVLQMAGEICDGMAYLAAKKYVHRDLAARNCMVAEDNTVKIGDFGMTRDIYETDYYRKGGKGLLPVRWMSPESLKDGVFASASDVWSFGVVLWEMATLAQQPYQGMSNEEVLKYVQTGNVMSMPEGCPTQICKFMAMCWQYYPKQRPTFRDLIKMLEPDLSDRFREVSYFNSAENEADLQHAAEKESYEGSSENELEMDASHIPLTVFKSNERTTQVNNSHNLLLEKNMLNGNLPSHGNSGIEDHDSSDENSIPAYTPMLEFKNVKDLDKRRESTNSYDTNSAIHSNDGSKESSTSKSSNGSSHRNGFVNGHAHRIPSCTEC